MCLLISERSEYGQLASRLPLTWYFRAAEKKAASTAVPDDETEPEPEPTSDIEPEKETATKKAKKGKGTGGIRIPEDWPWEEAKKLFENPDVIPAEEVEVGCHAFFPVFYFIQDSAARVEGP